MDQSLPAAADVYTLPSHEIAAAWGWIKRFLDRVDAYDWQADDVMWDLIQEKAQLWCVIGSSALLVRAIVITRIESTPSRKWGVIWIAAGEGIEQGLEILRAHIEPWFKSKGCTQAHIYGRKGWGRVLPEYEEKARVFVKELQ